MFTPPIRGERITWAVFYSFIVACGLFVLVVPPMTIEAPLGRLITSLWGLLLMVSVVLVAAALTGRFKWEYAALPLVISGVAIYAATVWYLTLDLPSRGAQASALTALALGLGRRWLDRRALVKQDNARQQRADPKVAG